MAIYNRGDSAVEFKSDASPVTEADIAAHRILAAGLAPLLPDCPVVSEEDSASHQSRQTSGRFWLIDPLDGTKEFIARNGEFTVNIALIDHGKSILGVVYAPSMNAMYWGGEGWGAFCTKDGHTMPIRVGSPAADGACRVVASKSHLNASTQAMIDKLGEVALIQAGSSLKFCRVAEGVADFYPRMAPTCEWDTAAAQAVLEGAGGVVVDLDGVPLRYGKTDILNPSFIATRDKSLIPA